MEYEDIRQDYEAELESLTFNSKPIISNLTIIAQENLGAAPLLARAIETRILKVMRKSRPHRHVVQHSWRAQTFLKLANLGERGGFGTRVPFYIG